MNRLFWISLIFISFSSAILYSEAVFDFLNITTDARDNGLGGYNYTMDWNGRGLNPARYAIADDHSLYAGFRSYLVDTNIGNLGGVYKLDDKTGIGGGIQFIAYGSMKKTTIDNPTGEGLGEFSALDMVFNASISREIAPRLQAGFSVKPVLSRIEESKSSGMVFDLGLNYSKEKDGIQFGLVLKNFGWQISKYTDETDEESTETRLPVNIGLGASQFLLNRFSVAGNYTYEVESKTKFFSAGVEVLPYGDLLALRLGYNSKGTDYDTGQDSDFLGGFSTGLGLFYRKINLDYGLSFYGGLGQTHSISIGYTLSGNKGSKLKQ
ncbi:MAG: PorV/PorQ family protein [Candidatus Coatesbacteria bacterium]|nr:PorV/PorQ family protein [Candidatus Coatesbacteria bacterium]